jgi:hypothetical protein
MKYGERRRRGRLKLYHFASPLHVDGCLKNGIIKGVIPIYKDGKYGFIPGFQWLTSNPEFHQEGANTEYTTLPYDRTEYRLTVVIPKAARDRLFRWLDICDKLPIGEAMNAYGDPENWFVFQGRIKSGWIRRVERKEVAHEANHTRPAPRAKRHDRGGPTQTIYGRRRENVEAIRTMGVL